MATVSANRPKNKPARFIRILEQPTPDTDGWGAIEITVGKQTATYLCRFIPCDFDGVLGLELEKLDAELAIEERYTLALGVVDPKASRCECLGFIRHGHCKHVEGTGKLVELGVLKPTMSKPLFRSASEMAKNDPQGWDEHLADVA